MEVVIMTRRCFIGKKDHFDSKFAELTNLFQTARAEMPKCVTSADYKRNYRGPINMKMLEILLGAEFTPGRNSSELKVKYNDTRCSISDLDRVVKALSAFVNEAEVPFLRTFQDSSGMSVDINKEFYNDVVIMDSKMSKKEMRNALFGYAGKNPICEMYLRELDIITIAANAEDLRKRMLRNEILIIAGVTLVTVAAATGVAIYMKNKKEEDEKWIDSSDDISSDSSVDSIIEMHDVPVVEF